MAQALDSKLGDLRCLRLENESFSLSILPEVGAKILNLFDKKNDRHVLWENPRIRPQIYPIDANFDNYWCGGWDDAFPTADACVHQGEPYPNVGELRSLKWDVEELQADGKYAIARMSVYGPISPIRATKTVSLFDQVLEMRFRIESQGPLLLDFLWGTHPAFAVVEGTRLIIPARTGLVQQSTDPQLGTSGQRYDWPNVGETDMSIVQSVTAGIACGHIATDLEDGWFAIETNGAGIVYEFPLDRCPHLWLWLVYGGWRGYHHAIVEPWTGYPVNLSQAVEQGRHSQLLAGGVFDATVRCTAYMPSEGHMDALKRLRKS